MTAQKLFVNDTDLAINVTLHIREGDLPASEAGTETFSLAQGQAKTVTYGDEDNMFLNGIDISGADEGKSMLLKQLTIQRGNRLDNELNTNNTVEIHYDGEMFHLVTRNSYRFGS